MNKLFRSTTDSKLTGLCGGIAEWIGVSPTIIRLIVAFAALCSFGNRHTALLHWLYPGPENAL